MRISDLIEVRMLELISFLYFSSFFDGLSAVRLIGRIHRDSFVSCLCRFKILTPFNLHHLPILLAFLLPILPSTKFLTQGLNLFKFLKIINKKYLTCNTSNVDFLTLTLTNSRVIINNPFILTSTVSSFGSVS